MAPQPKAIESLRRVVNPAGDAWVSQSLLRTTLLTGTGTGTGTGTAGAVEASKEQGMGRGGQQEAWCEGSCTTQPWRACAEQGEHHSAFLHWGKVAAALLVHPIHPLPSHSHSGGEDEDEDEEEEEEEDDDEAAIAAVESGLDIRIVEHEHLLEHIERHELHPCAPHAHTSLTGALAPSAGRSHRNQHRAG